MKAVEASVRIYALNQAARACGVHVDTILAAERERRIRPMRRDELGARYATKADVEAMKGYFGRHGA